MEKSGVRPTVLFLEASDDVLVQRLKRPAGRIRFLTDRGYFAGDPAGTDVAGKPSGARR